MLDEQMRQWWEGDIIGDRDVPDQGLCVLRRFIFTTGLCTRVSIDALSCDYAARYCYPSLSDARHALAEWDGVGDPPGAWIKEKVSGRLGPGAQVSDEERALHERIRLARAAHAGE
jgi:hypothetical protein